MILLLYREVVAGDQSPLEMTERPHPTAESLRRPSGLPLAEEHGDVAWSTDEPSLGLRDIGRHVEAPGCTPFPRISVDGLDIPEEMKAMLREGSKLAWALGDPCERLAGRLSPEQR